MIIQASFYNHRHITTIFFASQTSIKCLFWKKAGNSLKQSAPIKTSTFRFHFTRKNPFSVPLVMVFGMAIRHKVHFLHLWYRILRRAYKFKMTPFEKPYFCYAKEYFWHNGTFLYSDSLHLLHCKSRKGASK